MFNQDATLALENSYSKKIVVLLEPQTTDSKIIIRCVPPDTVVINLDNSFSNQKLFQGNSGECKRADFLIISEEKKCVLFIEMKKTSKGKGHIIKQLKGSLCAFEYCQAIAREFFQKNSFLDGYKKRFISINHTGMANRKTQIDKDSPQHDTPEKLLKVSWADTIEFNKLAA